MSSPSCKVVCMVGQSPAEAFESRVIRGEPLECWGWRGSHLSSGYSQVNLLEGHWTGHRLAYFLEYGNLPEQVHHRCGNRGCVNPGHLVGMTLREHQAEHHVKDRCLNGHWFTPENTYIRPDGLGRQCRRCAADRARRRRRALPLDQRKALNRSKTERRRRGGQP